MSQAELVQRAKKGDVNAIAQLLHLSLYSRGIRVKVHQAPNCLQILLEANRFPTRQHLVAFIHRGIAQLQVTTFKTVEIYARHPDTTQFIWCDGFDVNAPVPKLSASPNGTYTASSTSNRNTPNRNQRIQNTLTHSTVGRHPQVRTDFPELGENAACVLDAHRNKAEVSSLAKMSPAAIAQQARARMAAMPKTTPTSGKSSHHKKDLGWMLVDKLQGVNPFAMGLITILALHSILGSRHYTPEGFIAARDPMMMFLHNINLIIHEAGHPIFGILGAFMGLLGGSLMQVLVPGVIAGYFLLTHQQFAWTIALWWTGQSTLDVSLYIKDAQERALPLLGGEAVLHDWHFLLIKMNLLPYDDVIAGIVYSIGILAYLVAIALGYYHAYTAPKKQIDIG